MSEQRARTVERGRSKGLTRTKAIFATAALCVGGVAVLPAEASHNELSLLGSNFEIEANANIKVDDPSPSIDWANVNELRKVDTPAGPNDESFGNGTKEDTAAPNVVDGGIPPNKSDLKAFGVYQEGASSSGFLSLFWTRVQDPSGTTNMDFELNQKQCTPNTSDSDCTANGLTPIRTVGDKLITYDLSNGGVVATISIRSWGGNSWGVATNLTSSNDAKGSVNTSAIAAGDSDTLGAQDVRTFGEAHIRTAALFTGVVGCNGFGSAYLKSRSSDSFTSALKDFVPPASVSITNCGTVTIHKQDDGGSALAGVQFQLYNDATPTGGSRGNEDALTNPLISCVTDGSGNCVITNVPFGEYWVHEVAAPSGYTAAADQHVSVTTQTPNPTTLTFVDNRNPASVSLHKQDDLGVALQGVVFTLYNDFGTIDGTRQADTIDTPVNPAKSCTTDASGNCSITGILPVGNFWLVETTVPAGHDPADDRAITLGLGQNLNLTDPFVNPRQPASVKLHKQNDLGTAMSGVVFTLYNDFDTIGGTRQANTIDTPVNPAKSCTTDGSGNCTISGILPAGNFWLVETTTPAGHTKADDRSITLGLGQDLDITNAPFVNTRLPASVTLRKVNDVGAVLAGATFTLYNDFGTIGGTRQADTIDTPVNPAKSCISDVNGDCTISGILPVGNFWLVETNVPSGYTGAADRAISLILGQDLDITAAPFTNTRQFRVVTFVCIDSSDTLYGAKVAYDGAALPGSVNTPVAGGTITSSVESAICGLSGTAVHSGTAGAHSASVSIP